MSQGKPFLSQVTNARHLITERKTTNATICHCCNVICLSGFYCYPSSHIIAVTYRTSIFFFLFQLFKDKLAILGEHSLSLRKNPYALFHRLVTDFHIHHMTVLKSSGLHTCSIQQLPNCLGLISSLSSLFTGEIQRAPSSLAISPCLLYLCSDAGSGCLLRFLSNFKFSLICHYT